MIGKRHYWLNLVSLIAIFFLGFDAYNTRHNIENLKIINYAELERSKLLTDELNEIKYECLTKPTYNEGYRDAIIRIGTPTQAGAYRDGYYAAFLTIGSASYADGYHAAISQYGFPKTDLPPITESKK